MGNRIIVAGGGHGGIATAMLLAKKGFDVTVYEKNCADNMGYDWTDGLVHIPYGLVSLDGAKLSTRGGNIIYAEDILKEAIERAMNAIMKKNPELEKKEEVAHMVGVGAVIFHDLFNQRIKNIDFNWDEVLSFEGTSGPYIQYTYARAKSILRKADYENEYIRNHSKKKR